MKIDSALSDITIFRCLDKKVYFLSGVFDYDDRCVDLLSTNINKNDLFDLTYYPYEDYPHQIKNINYITGNFDDLKKEQREPLFSKYKFKNNQIFKK